VLFLRHFGLHQVYTSSMHVGLTCMGLTPYVF
jgi:hypothetical protein